MLTQPLNTAVSNGPYNDWVNKGKPVKGKRTALQDHSLLVLNREISAHDAWGEDSIIARGKNKTSKAPHGFLACSRDRNRRFSGLAFNRIKPSGIGRWVFQ